MSHLLVGPLRGWGGEPPQAALCVLSIVNKLIVFLDNVSILPVVREMKKVEDLWPRVIYKYKVKVFRNVLGKIRKHEFIPKVYGM